MNALPPPDQGAFQDNFEANAAALVDRVREILGPPSTEVRSLEGVAQLRTTPSVRLRDAKAMVEKAEKAKKAEKYPFLERDKQALVALYNATGGPTSWKEEKKAGWLVGDDVGMWPGVTVTDGRVTKLDLGRFGLKGAIPVGIGNLTALTWLDLNSNKLTGAWALASPWSPRAVPPPPPAAVSAAL